MGNNGTKSVEILLAEDEEADIDLVRQATKKFKICNHLHVVRNGAELLSFLRKEGEYRDAPTPDLILLDLNMPIMNGREALEKIRADDTLTHLPIVVMTSSAKEEDIIKSYKLHANCYVQKPMRMAEFEKVVQNMETFWFQIVKLPTKA
jgi:chemotaxis family two-component system response regulator Rcp1